MNRIFFHRTTEAAARSILAHEFRDSTGKYMTETWQSGVWVSDVPLDSNEGAEGNELLALLMDISDNDADKYEWVEEREKGYREWLFPADLLNFRAAIVQVTDLESYLDFDVRIAELANAKRCPG